MMLDSRVNRASYTEEAEFIIENFKKQNLFFGKQGFEKPALMLTHSSSLLDVGKRIALVSILWQHDVNSDNVETVVEARNAEVLQLTFLLKDKVAHSNKLILYKPIGFTLPPTCFCDQDSGKEFAEICMKFNQLSMENKWSLVKLIGSICHRLRDMNNIERLFNILPRDSFAKSISQQFAARTQSVLAGDDVLLCALRFSALHKRHNFACFPRPWFFQREERYDFESLVRTIDKLPGLNSLETTSFLPNGEVQARLLQWLLCLGISLKFICRKQSNLIFHVGSADARKFSRSIRAFHGTSAENVWSILQNGLQNTINKKHGEAFGKGIYLSTKFEVAEAFAQSTNRLGFFRDKSIIPELILGHTSANMPRCFCIFECELDLCEKAAIKQEEHYLIAKDARHIKIVNLHLCFDRTYENQVQNLRLLSILTVLAVFLAIFLAGVKLFTSSSLL